MSLEVAEADRETVARWDDYVGRSPHGTPFHELAFLRVVAEHSGTELRLLAGFTGEEPVGVFPVFAGSVGPFSTAFSPPPDVGLYQLGPALLDHQSLKRRRREQRDHRFVDGCLDWLEEQLDPSFLHARTHPAFGALRPFGWRGCTLTPRFTYVVDLTPSEGELLEQFSSDARRNVRQVRDGGACTVEEGGREAIRRIVAHVQRRFEDHRLSAPIEVEFVLDLYDALPAGRLRPYVCTVDGTYATGMLTLESETTAYRWQGGVRPTVDVPANEFLDWRLMQEAKARGRTRFDLVGANVRELCEYKAKFAPAVEEYHAIVGGRWWMRTAADLYQRLPAVRQLYPQLVGR